jgi:hypothetical protein
MKAIQFRAFASFVVLLLWSWLALAAATTTAVTGSVEATSQKGVSGALAIGQRIESGSTIKTSERSSAVLRFDDGQSISLAGNTIFVVNEYNFNPHKPDEGGLVATLLRGAMRAVTGLIGETTPQNVKFRTETATIGIRGTDFILHFTDSRLYLQVAEGAISATNSAGVEVFDAVRRSTGMVSSSSTLPQTLQPSELPTSVLGDFRQLSAVPITGKERRPGADDPTCSDRR